MKALGDQLYIIPSVHNGSSWIGKIVDRGASSIKFSTYNICDKVVYQSQNIIKSAVFEGKSVHVISFENIRKIEGVY